MQSRRTSPLQPFRDRTILITGGSSGLGLHIAELLAAEGASLILWGRDGVELEAVGKQMNERGQRCATYRCDVSSRGEVSAVARRVLREHGPVDILINNAGVYGGDHQRAGDLDYDAWIRTLAINTLGPVRVLEALKGNLLKAKTRKAIAITSAMGSTARHDGGALIYRSSKAALNNAMHGLALAFKGDGITVVPMHPGWVRTDMGGSGAPLSPEQAVGHMRKVIAGLKPADSGRYINYDGSEIAW